jgi:tripartite-type tricarboxylate transporter receptor subunit TctC
VHYALLALSPIKPFIDSGAVKVIAVMSPERFPALPDVPTVIESGFPNLTLDWWYGLVAPAGTPHEIRTLVGDAIVKIMSEQKAADALAPLGILPAPMATDPFGELIKGDIERWTKFANDQGIVPA